MDIVLVEDSPLIVGQLLEKIRQQPALRVVGTASSEEAAVRLILHTMPDAVILDLALSAGSGLSVLSRIRQAGSSAQVLVLTNHVYPELRDACLTAGAGNFFDKHSQSDICIQTLVAMDGGH